MTYVKSKDIQLFPSAFRGQYETTGTVFNPGSRLTTEYNLTTLSSRTSKYHQSYVLQYDDETADKTIVFSLKGYLFEIKMASYLSEPPLSGATNIWAKIKLVSIDSDDVSKPNTIDTKPVLVPLSGGDHILDEGTTEGEFLGLSLETTDPTLENEEYKLLILEKVGVAWSVPSKSYFRLRADEISDKTSTNKSIDEEFNTITLNATDLRIENISANYFADESLNISAESIVLNLDYGFESSDNNFNFAGNIVTTESLQVSNDTNNSGATIYGSTIIYNGSTANFTLTPGTSIVTTLPITISSAATSTSPITGALKVEGGVGIKENLNVAKLLSVGSVGSGSVAGTSSMKLFNRSLSATATTLQPGVGTTDIALTLPIVAGTLARIEDIEALDVAGTSSFGAGKTIDSWSETDGKVSITSQDIAIASSQISDKTNDYNSSGETVVTGKAVAAALATLDVTETTNTAGKTISAWSEVDGKVSISTQNISITSSQISDKTDSYSSSGEVVVTGKAVNEALKTLDVSGTLSFGAGNTISAWSEMDGKVSISSQAISITKTQVSDFEHTHSYAGSTSAGGSATTATTTADTSNTLYLVGVTSGATTTLKRDTSITMQGGNLYATTFYASSDRRLKENIVDYKYHDSILDIAVKEFDYKNTNVHTIGFVAQELQEKFPELVTSGENGYLSIAENKLVYLLLEEVKQLKEEVEQLKRGG